MIKELSDADSNGVSDNKPSIYDAIGSSVALLIEHQLGIAKKTRSAEEVYRAIEPHMRRLVTLKLRELSDVGRIARYTFELRGPDGIERYERYGMRRTVNVDETTFTHEGAQEVEVGKLAPNGINGIGANYDGSQPHIESLKPDNGENCVESSDEGLAGASRGTAQALEAGTSPTTLAVTGNRQKIKTVTNGLAGVKANGDQLHDMAEHAFESTGIMKSDELRKAIVPEFRKVIALNVGSNLELLSMNDAGRAILRTRGIETIGSLVSHLDSLKSGTSSTRLLFRDSYRELRGRAIPIGLNDLGRTAGILLSQAGSKEFLFDAFGNLRRLALTDKEAEYRDLSQGLCIRIKMKRSEAEVIKSIYSEKTGAPLICIDARYPKLFC